MDTSAYCSTAGHPSATPSPAPFFRLGEPAPLSRIRDCLKKCLPTGLRAAFDGGDTFSVLDVRPPVVLNVSAPDPAIDRSAWVELAVTIVFEVPVSLIERGNRQ